MEPNTDMKLSTLFALSTANLAYLNAFKCLVKKNNTILFSYDIEEFMINDGICDCCDCSDELNIAAKTNYCDDLINEYESILQQGLIKNNIDEGKKELLNTLILKQNELVKEYELLKKDNQDIEEIEDVKVYKKLTTEIIAFFEESFNDKKSHAEVSKKHQKENIENLKKFFHKEIPMIMIGDKQGLKKIHSDIKNMKSLKDKLMIVKFMLSNLEGTSGVSFKYTQELSQLDDIVQRYGDEFFQESPMFNIKNFVKDSIYGIDSRVSTYKLQRKHQNYERLSQLENELSTLYDSYTSFNVIPEIETYFSKNNTLIKPMTSIFGKYVYTLTQNLTLLQKSMGENNEEYLIGSLSSITFKSNTPEDYVGDVYEMMWKHVQTHPSRYLYKSIPDEESAITKEVLEKSNVMKMKFEEGDGCWNGPERSAVVRFQCSKERFEVVEVVEVEKCSYEIDVDSIFGCV